MGLCATRRCDNRTGPHRYCDECRAMIALELASDAEEARRDAEADRREEVERLRRREAEHVRRWNDAEGAWGGVDARDAEHEARERRAMRDLDPSRL